LGRAQDVYWRCDCERSI